jgi:quercetin dioxygenase-like cupin family protein
VFVLAILAVESSWYDNSATGRPERIFSDGGDEFVDDGGCFHGSGDGDGWRFDGAAGCEVGTSRFRASTGDCVLAPKGIGHGLENVGDSPARLITIYPTADPERESLDDVAYTDGNPGATVFVRGENEPFEFMAGVSRYDMVGDFLGSVSLFLSELVFEPGSIAPNHYHPGHEESMFCLEGELNAVYADENNVLLKTGDCFTCEVGIRHGIYNVSSKPARLLAIHPVLNPPPRIDVD